MDGRGAHHQHETAAHPRRGVLVLEDRVVAYAWGARRRWGGDGFTACVADPGLVDTAINRCEWPAALRGALLGRREGHGSIDCIVDGRGGGVARVFRRGSDVRVWREGCSNPTVRHGSDGTRGSVRLPGGSSRHPASAEMVDRGTLDDDGRCETLSSQSDSNLKLELA